MTQITKYLAFIRNGEVQQKGRIKAPEEQSLNIPEGDYDEVIEISEEDAMSEYPLEYKNGQVTIDVVKKNKIDADKVETKKIKDKVKNKEDISNTEFAWLQGHGG